MFINHNYNVPFRCFTNGAHGSRPITSSHERTALLAFVLAATLVMALAAGAMLHAGEPGQTIVPHQSADDTGLIQDLVAFAPLPGYAFAQTPQDDTPPTFVSSGLNLTAGNLAITFSEAIDVTSAANVVVPSKIHIRESGNYTGGITLSAGEFVTVVNGTAISFTLTPSHLTTVTGLTMPELTIEPGAVQDTLGNLIVGTFDASTAVFVNATSIKSEDDDPRGMTFSNDGTKMFVVGNQGGAIIEYTLSPAFDASTANFTDTFSVLSEEKIPTGMAFSNNGTKMFVVGYVGTNVTEYTLPTAFNVSTAVFVDTFSVSSEIAHSSDITFSNDGTKMFVVSMLYDIITEYILSTAFDVSTAVFVPPSFSVASEETYPLGMTFSNDGAKMFVVGSRGEAVNEYTLSSAFDVSTADFVDATLISSENIYLSGVAFSNDGAKMFVVEKYGADIYEYTLSSVYPITVNDTVAPDTTPPDITLTGDNPTVLTVGGTYTEQGAVCDDDVDADKPATPSGTVNTLTPGSYTLTYSCTDASGNPAVDVTRIVRVDAAPDNTPPVITLTGDNPTVLTVGGTYTEQGAVCDDDVDADKPATPSGTVNTLTPGSYTLTYSCTDASGNPAVDVTRIVRVDAAPDNTPPVITLTGDNPTVLTVGGTYTEQGAVCDDDVDADKPATPSGTVNTLTPGSYTLTYSCTDASGNPAVDVTRIVRVDAAPDNTPPVITLTGDNPTVLTVGGTYTEQGAVCDDDVDADKPATPSGTVNTLTPGSYTLTYSCTDASGNPAVDVTRIVRVDAAPDNTPPVITLTGDNPTVLTVGGTYTEQGAVCDDDVDADKPATPSGTVNTLTPGSYTLTYSCTDASGNPAVDVTRIVRVDAAPDNTPPVITLTGDNPTVLTVGGTYTEQGAVCDDDVDADKPATPSGTVNTLTPGSYTLTYSCTDASGNPAVDVTRTVTVQPDTTKPVITIQGANPARIVVNGTYADAGAACTDAVDGTIIPTVVSNTVDTTQTGTYAVTYSCTDAAGNDATPVTRTVIVQTAVIPDTDRSSKSRSNNTPNPLTTDNSIIIDGQSYDLGSGTTTTTNPYYITTGQATDLVFTAYSPSDIVRFTIYLNLHGDDIKHSDSDTYIRYDHGVVEIVDPHGFISDASITITEDLEQSRKKIINTLIEFEGNMGLTNMAVYIWNEDRRYTSIRVFNALDITSGTETLPEPVESDSGLTADPEPVAPGFEDDAVDPEHTSSDTPWPDDYDDAQVLTLIRMWSGFEAESITDAQLLELLGIEDYQGVDLPDWMMTELGVLVAKGDVTVDEFVLALQYVLTHA